MIRKMYTIYIISLLLTGLVSCFGSDTPGSDNTFTVSFNANGGSGSMRDLTAEQGGSVFLPANTFTAPSVLIFAGWKEARNSKTIFCDKALYPVVHSDTTLYANWTKPAPPEWFEYTVTNGDMEITGLTSMRDLSVTDLVLPSTINDLPVTSLGYLAFYNTNITSVVIPATVKKIGQSAFSNCKELTTLRIPDTVKILSKGAFSNCSALISVVIPASVNTIATEAFYNCSNLIAVDIQNGITEIGGSSFQACNNLRSVVLPPSVTIIGDRAFRLCSNLVTVNIPEAVMSIESHAFDQCQKLTAVSIPASVTTIGDYAFASCGTLQAIDVDERNMHFISIDGVLFTKDLKILKQYPANKPGTDYITPTTAAEIGPAAFSGCQNLVSVFIDEPAASIGSSAFRWCINLQTVTIPGSVTSMSYSVFYGCRGLTAVEINAAVPPALIDSFVFPDDAPDMKIYVPGSSLSAYQSAQYWSAYINVLVGQ